MVNWCVWIPKPDWKSTPGGSMSWFQAKRPDLPRCSTLQGLCGCVIDNLAVDMDSAPNGKDEQQAGDENDEYLPAQAPLAGLVGGYRLGHRLLLRELMKSRGGNELVPR